MNYTCEIKVRPKLAIDRILSLFLGASIAYFPGCLLYVFIKPLCENIIVSKSYRSFIVDTNDVNEIRHLTKRLSAAIMRTS